MLGLVGPHRHIVCLIQQDIRCHQGGIGEQACIDVIRVFRRLVFELGHAGQFPEQRVAGQNPAQFRMVVHVALNEQQTLLRVDAAGQQQRKRFQALPAQLGRFLTHGQRVQVCNKVSALIVFLQLLPVTHCTDIISQSKSTGRLDTAEDTFFLFRFLNFLQGFFCQFITLLSSYFRKR